ncbi:hypothetical protein L21SP5_01411 [Salinivirga cyanobacteriivorans]|uniref:DUF5777 domain-containing protein n=1 Tax=Salinivirga cyanobacteriivorans TaxID=1307839 RepID=A0A0S2HYH3_9BACT|nr:DUF5777 family beta-barrel protein [Salinivirga cyanobacteriivorans]ALO15061.1 hypothetical protein L21SP5_01411 [Salinivirga cyanobacteriivorans]
MKKILLLLPVLFLSCQFLIAQETEKETKSRPVRAPFESPYLLDNQTTFILPEKTLQMAIQHKFGTMEEGISDLYGIYSSANIRIGFDYVPYKNVQVGYGLTRTNMTHDFNAKWTVFEQTRDNSRPLGLALYRNMGIDGREKENLGAQNAFPQRLSYFGQLIMSRKFGYRVSVQLGASFSHFNMTDTSRFDYDRVGIHFNGRVRVAPTGNIVFNYDQPLDFLRLSGTEEYELNPNITIGYEIVTSTHAFHLYMGYTNHLLPQYAMVRETKEFELEQFNFGFTITRLWSF